ncbi:MAG: hypothetical protein DMG74_07075 [Acidobacteria bacterium]|nr:MAG: hypothetical protein DMG75_00590 [Acidobacteriota bacterium]PYX65832.1 MAG: hypothetical protein DMG74_07075 [Acidobacteriota bacterium]
MKVSLVGKNCASVSLTVFFLVLIPSPSAAQMPREVKSPEDGYQLAATIDKGIINDQHGYLKSADGTCLFYRYWPAAQQHPDNPVVLVLHGIGYHSAPYKVIGDALNPAGIDVYALDARGHGLSCGKRGSVGSPGKVREDVSAMVRLVKAQRPSAKFFLLGESMGGAFALNYAKENSDQITGLILLAPAIGVPMGQFFRLSNLPLLPYYLFWHNTPAISLIAKRLDESSRDATFIAARRADPLAYQKVSFRYLREISALVKNWKTEIAPRVKAPTLIVQGAEDRIVSKKDCAELSKVLAAPNNLELFPGVRHTTLWDPDTQKILGEVRKWVEEH